MGTWGIKPFQNDSALDWVADLEKEGIELVRRALKAAADQPPELELECRAGEQAVAAAELIAAALSGDTSRLPHIRGWWPAVKTSFTPADAELAVRALARAAERNSEVWELLSADDQAQWQAGADGLRRKLSEVAAGTTAVSATDESEPTGSRGAKG